MDREEKIQVAKKQLKAALNTLGGASPENQSARSSAGRSRSKCNVVPLLNCLSDMLRFIKRAQVLLMLSRKGTLCSELSGVGLSRGTCPKSTMCW